MVRLFSFFFLLSTYFTLPIKGCCFFCPRPTTQLKRARHIPIDDHAYYLPKELAIFEGINLHGVCINKTCSRYEKEVVVHFFVFPNPRPHAIKKQSCCSKKAISRYGGSLDLLKKEEHTSQKNRNKQPTYIPLLKDPIDVHELSEHAYCPTCTKKVPSSKITDISFSLCYYDMEWKDLNHISGGNYFNIQRSPYTLDLYPIQLNQLNECKVVIGKLEEKNGLPAAPYASSIYQRYMKKKELLF